MWSIVRRSRAVGAGGLSLGPTCTVSVDGEATRSCRLPVSSVGERAVVTIEGLEGLESPAGLAVRKSFGSCVAEVADVTVKDDGGFTVTPSSAPTGERTYRLPFVRS